MLAVITLSAILVWAFWAIAVPAALAYLGGRLLAPDMKQPDVGPTADAQSRSWNPRTTQREGNVRPRAYGKNMHHGNVVAKWTAVVDDREVLYMIIEHGDGPTKGVVEVDGTKQIWLNDQPIANFTSVEVQERVGTFNQTCMTGFEKTKLEYKLGDELVQNEPIIFTTHNDFFDDLEFTITWPNGLHKYQKDGDRRPSGLSFRVRIREYPSGSWTQIFEGEVYVYSPEPLFRLYKVSELGFNCDRGKQYDLEFTNLTAPHPRNINDVYIKSVREVVDVAFKYPGRAIVGIRAIATEQLSGNIDVKVVREDRLMRTWNGSDWSIEYSRNRSWVAFDALTQPVIDGDGESAAPFVVDHYEGIDPSHLDLTFFYNWAEFCSAQIASGFPSPDHLEDRIACDTILDFQTDVWTFINEIAHVGRASLYWQGHVLTGWIDKAVSEITALVTMDNIMSRTWKNRWTNKNELAGKVEVFFQDSRQGYERMPASLPNESAGKYTKIVSVEGIGITTRGAAIHAANHILKRNELIRNINNFRQYKAAFRYKLGQVIRIQHKAPDWGESYRVIESTANNKVTLDRVCTAVATDLIFVQGYDETLKKVCVDSYTVASVAGKIVTIEETWDITPLKNYMVAIGADGDIKLRRITEIDSTTDNYFDITVETYDATLFAADDMTPDNPDQHYIWDKPANPLTRPVTRAEVIALINQALPPALDTEVPLMSNIAWTGNDVDTIYWAGHAASGEDDTLSFRYRGESYDITPDDTTDEFVYWDPDYVTTFRTTNNASVALAPGNWLMCRNKNGVAYPANAMQLLHGAIIQAATITAALGQIANLTVDTLQIAGVAVTTGKIADDATKILATSSSAWQRSHEPHGAYSQILTCTMTSLGNAIRVEARAEHAYANDGDVEDAWIRLREDGNVVAELHTPNWGDVFAYSNLRVPGAGSVTYALDIKADGGATRIYYKDLFIYLVEDKGK